MAEAGRARVILRGSVPYGPASHLNKAKGRVRVPSAEAWRRQPADPGVGSSVEASGVWEGTESELVAILAVHRSTGGALAVDRRPSLSSNT